MEIEFSTEISYCQFKITQDIRYVNGGYWFFDSQLPVSNIVAELFTHLFCAFADIDRNSKEVTISSSKLTDIGSFSAFVKSNNPDVKTLLSIGGDGADPVSFASMVADSGGRKSFIDSSISLARKYKFDGLDLHWLYPSSKTEMTHFELLLKEWRNAIFAEARQYHTERLILVASVFYSPTTRGGADYPITTMVNCLDWINIVAYDLYTPSSSPDLTAPPAAFYNPNPEGISGFSGIKRWIEKGFPSKWMVIGLCFHGRAWLLENPDEHDPFSPASGAEISVDGYADYFKIKEFIDENEAEPVSDTKYVFSYCHWGKIWIGYDDDKSISEKVSVVKKDGLLGYFAWHVAGDDEYCSLASAASKHWDANTFQQARSTYMARCIKEKEFSGPVLPDDN